MQKSHHTNGVIEGPSRFGYPMTTTQQSRSQGRRNSDSRKGPTEELVSGTKFMGRIFERKAVGPAIVLALGGQDSDGASIFVRSYRV